MAAWRTAGLLSAQCCRPGVANSGTGGAGGYVVACVTIVARQEPLVGQAGRTDRWIARRIFEKFSVPYSEENFTRLIDGYIAALPTTLLNPRARVLPGVREILAQADARDDVVQGLLTGNLRRGAQTKLGHHGLWDFFPFGGFADDAEMRNEISPHALRRANEHAQITFSPDRVWVIGDTPHDIECGRVIGACTLAVATGSHTVTQLAEHQPDAVLPDLADVAAFWKLVG